VRADRQLVRRPEPNDFLAVDFDVAFFGPSTRTRTVASRLPQRSRSHARMPKVMRAFR